MTGSDDSYSNTRPISVAELLAKNGTIGAPPVGGRRRRRRGNSDAVTVAELTGEIPIIRPTDPDPREAAAAVEEQVTDAGTEVEADQAVSPNGSIDQVEAEVAEAEVVEAEVPEPEVAEPEVVEAEVPEPEAIETEAEPEAVEHEDTEAEAGPVESEDTDEAIADELEDELDTESEVVEPVAEADTIDDAIDDTVAAPGGDENDDDYADAVAEYAAHLEQRDADPEPVDFLAPAPRRFGFGRKDRKAASDAKGAGDGSDAKDGSAASDVTSGDSEAGSDATAGDAEQMSPDPLDDGAETDLLDSSAAVDEPVEIEDLDTEAALDADSVDDDDKDDDEELPSYLRSTQGPLFGGQTVADDLARRGSRPAPEDIDLSDADEDEDEDEYAEDGEPRRMSSFVHSLWIVGQSVIAVVLGAGLFVAFDQLWKWNNIVALVLSVLVILGLVVGVRVVRKTEDIGSTLIAVAVGALVTLGPLALLQSG